MTTLDDLFDPLDLEAAVVAGFVRVQTHPTEPYRIFNYTEQAVYSRTWTPVTKQCRGLIADTAGNVVARPWAKFFNHGEHAADALDLSAPVEVTDKADGSLGILYVASDGPAIATRGSFTSEQAKHATALYRDRYAGRWLPVPGWTYLFEIVFPSNRIVLDYGDLDDLILLGAVRIEDGALAGPQDDLGSGAWPGLRAEVQPYQTLAKALEAPPRPNAEGLVVRYLDGDSAGTMVKLKQADYVALHRIMTGFTARRLWERAAIFAVLALHPETTPRALGQALRMDVADVQGIIDAGPDWADEVRKTAPEEFTDWIDTTIAALNEQADQVLFDVHRVADDHAGMERRDIAGQIANHPYRGMIFAALDGKPVVAQAWASIRPDAEKPYAARGEDVA